MTASEADSLRPRATMIDVAKRAGVSQATVSLVLNDAGGTRVAAATRARVHEAAGALGYRIWRRARGERVAARRWFPGGRHHHASAGELRDRSRAGGRLGKRVRPHGPADPGGRSTSAAALELLSANAHWGCCWRRCSPAKSTFREPSEPCRRS